MRPAIFAHRLGRAYGPDNSSAALHHSLRQPIDGVETDCCLTADGRIALLHDPLLEVGTTLSGWAHRRTAAEIQAGRLLHRDGTPSEQHPLLLDELLDLAPPRVKLQLEIKAHADPELARCTTRTVCKQLEDHPARAHSEIISFYTSTCQLAAHLGFRSRLVIIADYEIAALANWARTAGVHGICVEHFLLTRSLTSALRADGLSVSTGTINHAALLQSLLPLAPDAVTSDSPHEFHATLNTAERPALAA